MLDLSGITKIKTIEVDELNINELGDSLSRLTEKRMSIQDKKSVYSTVRELEKYTPISWEFLRYLIATNNRSHRSVINLTNTSYLRGKTKSQMNKIKRILRSHCNITEISSGSYFKKLVCSRGNIGFMNTKRNYHFIKFKEKNLK